MEIFRNIDIKLTMLMRISLYYILIPAFILGSCASNSNSGNNTPADSTTVDTSNAVNTPDTLATPAAPEAAANATVTLTPASFKEGKVGKAKLTVTNTGQEELSFGDPYKVEFNNAGSWEKVTMFDSLMFTAMMHIVAPGKSQELQIDLQPVPHDYKPGEYRIIKGAYEANKQVTLTTTFTVGK